jgi:hypothetical protein
VFADGLQTLAAGLAAFVHAVAIRAFDDEDVGARRAFGRGQQRGVRRADVAAENHHGFFGGFLGRCALAERDFQFQVGRAQDVAGRLQPQAQAGFGWVCGVGLDDREPGFVGQRDDLLFQLRKHAADQRFVLREAHFNQVESGE